ncbi:hypothetical protein TraAM80_07607 [Trypanosoma rangeli]|uniref:Uncharacterized protein n=1 Tax=Trypanosoma rangeli TaxID=5698 RepID=A0A422N4N0_TRYRA|nr:uncharacterized protein TraAM80_07607 [Trypanosoma rangeli]RNF00414.1 hypothetical protein TraAM80_07607 [Trypanosoma rangeli]|eukprot:RNF00414.1 hypothetical protein TraAM80_07607 [Trypanosoma rangeli]
MKALVDAEGAAQSVIPGNPAWDGRGGGWQPPPSPWGADPPVVEKDVSGGGGNTDEGKQVHAGDSQQGATHEHACLPMPPVSAAAATHPAAGPLNFTALTDATPQGEGPVAQQSPWHPPRLVPTASVIVDSEQMPEMPEVKLYASPLRVKSPSNPPDMKDVSCPTRESVAAALQAGDNASTWSAFLELKTRTEDSVSRMTSFYDQIVKLQLTHEQEAAAYRDAAETMIHQQRKAVDALSLDCKKAQSAKESLQALLATKSQQLMEFENANYTLNVRLREAEQRIAHVSDRATVAETGRKIAEIHVKELEASLEHTTELVKALRQRLSESTRDKEDALQAQYKVFEENRRDIIHHYDARERALVQEFNDTVRSIQQTMIQKMKEREEHLSRYWQDALRLQHQQQQDFLRQVTLSKERDEKDYQANIVRVEQDKERWYDQYRSEMSLLEQRHREREQHILMDIARRERELGEREQRMRLQHAQEEQESKVALASKDAELKAYYQKITEDMRVSFDKEREKLTASFREQVQELSQLHLNNERELERMHRDKEREMAQRYRIAGYEVDDRKGEVKLRGVSLQAQSALLSKFDAIEARQRERAEKARAAFHTTSSPNTSPSLPEKEEEE